MSDTAPPHEAADRTPGVPFVSVIVPTHGRARLAGRLLDSLLAQDWPRDRYEIIVVHNYTDDGTDRAVQDRIDRGLVAIQYHRTNFNGPGPSRQFGADRARGDILAFIDDDCIATPGWIANGVAGISRGYALVQGRTLPNPEQPRRLLEKTVSVTGPTPFFETCNIFYDTAAFRAVGGFPEAFRAQRSGEDTTLGWAVLRAGYRTGFSADALVYHEVFAVSYRAWLRETNITAILPFVARAYPEFRRHLFLGLFVSRLTAAFDAFVLGLGGGILLHPALLLLCAPYLVLRFTDRGRHRMPHILLARLLFALPRQAMTFQYLVVNSIRARSAVL